MAELSLEQAIRDKYCSQDSEGAEDCKKIREVALGYRPG